MNWFRRRPEVSPDAGKQASKQKVMIVEDEKVVAKIYSMALEEAGFEVEVATDGQKALDRLHEFLPDVLLLDLQLPRVDGIEVLRRLRAQPVFKNLPVAVFTNAFLGELTDLAAAEGATMVLLKARSTPITVIASLRKCLAGGVTQPSRSKPELHATPSGLAIPFPAGKQVMEAMKEAEHDLWFNVRKQFLDDAPRALTELRLLLHDLPDGLDPETRLQVLRDLHARARSMAASASMAGFRNLAVHTSAFEALLRTVGENPAQITPSVVRTLMEGVDCFGMLFRATQPSDAAAPTDVRILVVDDDSVSSMLIGAALGKAGWKPSVIRVPAEALELLAREAFDLILLDVLMPEMDGFEVCRRLRLLPNHVNTPVVFVTSMDDFQNRTRGVESGGTDFIGKPFLHVELAVKVLNNILKSRASTREAEG